MSPLMRTVTRPWAPEVLVALRPGPIRFNRLMGVLDGVSDTTLTRRLWELLDAGLLERLVDCGPPIRVSYRLTAVGQRAAAVVQPLTQICKKVG